MWHKIKGILLQEYFISIRSTEIIFDILVLPIATTLLFGFLAQYISAGNAQMAHQLIVGATFWQIIYIAQYSLCMGTLWNIWSRNLSNIFISPIRVADYLLAYSLSATIKAVCILGINAVILQLCFGVTLLTLPAWLFVATVINMLLFGFTFGIVVLGLLFRFGTRINAFAWGMLPVLQPLSGALFPITVLPSWLQAVAFTLPVSYWFAAIHQYVTTNTVSFAQLLVGFAINVIYLLASIIFFYAMLQKSQQSGQFARNET